MKTPTEIDPLVDQLARKFAAAFISQSLGLKMDYALAHYLPLIGIGDYWTDLAKHVLADHRKDTP